MTLSVKKILIPILLLAFMARLGGDYYVSRQIEKQKPEGSGIKVLFPDSRQIYEIANNLADGKGHVDNLGRIAWRTPLYQMLIAGMFKAGFGTPNFIRFLQSIFGIVNVLLVYVLARRLGGVRSGLLAATVMALYPMLIYFNALVLTEALATTFVLLILCLWDTYLHEGREIYLFLTGLALGLAALHKASLGLLIMPLFMWTVIVRSGTGWQLHLRLATILLAGYLLLLGPWVWRNYNELGSLVPFSTMAGFTLYESTGPGADGGPNHGKVTFPPETDNLDEVSRDRALKRAVWAEVKRDPSRALWLSVRKFARTWSPVPNWSGAGAWYYQLAMLLSYVPVMLLAVAGIWHTRRRWRSVWFLLIPVLYLTAVHTVFMGSIRYRLPAMPCLIILAGIGADYLLSLLGRDGSQSNL